MPTIKGISYKMNLKDVYKFRGGISDRWISGAAGAQAGSADTQGWQLLTKLARRAIFDLLCLQGAHLGSGGGIWAKDG